MLSGLAVVLFNPKFSENIGSVARACLNMGCERIILVDPRSWDPDRAAPLATPKGAVLLARVEVAEDLESALSGFTHVYGTTARTGGWRKSILTPAQAGPLVAGQLAAGGRAALVFGPEDRGLTNAEIEKCGQLLTIPTASEGTSLNLAQAVLLVLYECFKAVMERPAGAAGERGTNLATHEDKELLFANLEQALTAIDYLKHDNTDYWMLPLRRFAQRFDLRRAEFNVLMGICRQMKWVAGQARPGGRAGDPASDQPGLTSDKIV